MREGEINKACWLPDIIIGQSCAVLWALMSVFIFVLGRPEWANVAPGGLYRNLVIPMKKKIEPKTR